MDAIAKSGLKNRFPTKQYNINIKMIVELF